jgi:hypothetical protein
MGYVDTACQQRSCKTHGPATQREMRNREIKREIESKLIFILVRINNIPIICARMCLICLVMCCMRTMCSPSFFSRISLRALLLRTNMPVETFIFTANQSLFCVDFVLVISIVTFCLLFHNVIITR